MQEISQVPLSWPEFKKNIVALQKPGLVGYLQHIKDLHGSTVVAVSISSSSNFYGDSLSNEQVGIKMGDFIDDAIERLKKGENGEQKRVLSKKEGENMEIVKEHTNMYLCQSQVWSSDVLSNSNSNSQLHKLESSYEIPCFLKKEKMKTINMWMNLQSTRTNCHYDAFENLLCVVHGKKIIQIFEPSQTSNLYPSSILKNSNNHSHILPFFPSNSLEKYPLFKEAKGQTIEVNAGEMLYLPEGWWHQVDSSSFSIAFNFWWSGNLDFILQFNKSIPFFSRSLMIQLIENEKSRIFGMKYEKKEEKLKYSDSLLLDFILHSSDFDAIANIFYNLEFSRISKLVVLAVEKEKETWKTFLTNMEPIIVEIITFRMEQQEQLEDIEYFYDSFFSPFEDRKQIIADFIRKKEKYSKDVFNMLISQVFGINS